MSAVPKMKWLAIISILVLAAGLLIPVVLPQEEAQAESWVEVADEGIAGFQRMQHGAMASAVFNDGSGNHLYIGTSDPIRGCRVLRYDSPNPDNWTQVSADGFGDANNTQVSSMAFFAHGGTTYLYAGTMNKITGCEVWRTAGVGGLPYTDWMQVNADGFGAAANDEATSMIGLGASLYVGTANPGGGQLLLTAGVGGPPYADWALSAAPGFGNAANIAITALAPFTSFNGWLHAGTRNLAGCEVWALTPGGWARVDALAGPGGFGNLPAVNTEASCISDRPGPPGPGVLFVGTANASGCQVWGSAGMAVPGPPPPYNDWARLDAPPAAPGGFASPNNIEATCLTPFGPAPQTMFVTTFNAVTGCEVYQSPYVPWTPPPPVPPPFPWLAIMPAPGFGNIANFSAPSMTVHAGNLYVGTFNAASGGEVWELSGVSGTWAQVNRNGFAPDYSIATSNMIAFKGQLYAGTRNQTTGCKVMRYDDPGWTQVNADGFGRDANTEVASMAVCGHGGTSYLYIGTRNGYGCEVWRTAGQGGPPYTDWTLVSAVGFGNARNINADSMAVFAHGGTTYLYVGTGNFSTGCEVWRTAGQGGLPYTDWTLVNAGGFGDPANGEVSSLAVYGPNLFAGTGKTGAGCELWRTAGQGGPPYADWAQVNSDGCGDNNNTAIVSMAAYAGGLHLGVVNAATGCEVWRTAGQGGPPFTDWAQVNADGFGSSANLQAVLSSFGGALYVGTGDFGADAEVWRTRARGGPPYTDWSQTNVGGFGNANNLFVYSLAVMGSGLYAGTYNGMEGCEVWRAKSNAWYLAEGSTDGGMETFVLVQNPGTSPVHVNIKFQTGTGEKAPSDLQGAVIDPTSRRTFKVNNYVTDFNVSTFVEATDGEVICERAMYGNSRTWAHDSIGFSP